MRQRGEVTAHSSAQLHEGSESGIVLASFDPTNVAAVETRFMCETLLRHGECKPLRTYALAEDFQVPIHLTVVIEKMIISPRSMSPILLNSEAMQSLS